MSIATKSFATATPHPLAVPVQDVVKTQIPLGSGIPLTRAPLSRRQMRERLDVLRSAADAGRTSFGLIVLTLPRKDRRPKQVRRLFSNKVSGSDVWGWLAGNQLGVVVCQTPEGTIAELRNRLRAFQARLAPLTREAIIFHYPLPRQSADGAEAGGTESGLVVEGGIEQYFILPTPIWKRSIDILGAGIGLALLWPLLALVALMIRCSSSGPVFFRQPRTGRGGRMFVMYKFRSMVSGAERMQAELRHLNEQDGPAFKIRRDPRITRLGWWLRATSIDELPQLWNVLKGEMSVVGPRPLPLDESAACLGWQRRRLDVTPGITCIWQTNGRTLVSFDEWMRQDIEYVQRRSFWFDLWLIVGTFPVLVPSSAKHSSVELATDGMGTELP